MMYVHFLLDRSGSMASIKNKTVDAYNECCNALKNDGETKVSLTTFDSDSIDLLRDNVSPETAKISLDEFQPRATTPLLDAIGQTVNHIDKRTDGIPRVAFTIITDGLENASREHTKASVKALLDERIKSRNWLVQFLGADQDAIAESGWLGVQPQNAMSFRRGSTSSAVRASSRNTQSYMKSGDATQGFTAEERAEAMKDNE